MTTNPDPNIPPYNGVHAHLQQLANARDAKQICFGCPVTDACLDAVLAHDERFGIWGGLSEQERRQRKRRMLDDDALFDDDNFVRRAG
jgi:hypothetical protein